MNQVWLFRALLFVCRWILKELGDDLTEEEIDDMIRDTDTDGSGFVDFDGTLTNQFCFLSVL